MSLNVAASVRARLLNLSRETKEPFQNLLIRYGLERLLYRISISRYAEDFVLKGANAFYAWTGQLHRPTKDLDVLKFGDSEPEQVKAIMIDVIGIDLDDGLEFDVESVRATEIVANGIYAGVELKLEARLGNAKIPIHVDFGVGDAVVPDAQPIEFPSLLDMERPKLRAYRPETVVAEKFEAMVKLGLANSRLKDFYDVMVLARIFEFDGVVLQDAVRSTFERRGTSVPDAAPVAWTATFTDDEAKLRQWASFLKKSGLEPMPLAAAVSEIHRLLEPVRASLVEETTLNDRWQNGAWIASG